MQIYVLLLPFHLLFLIMFSSPIVLGILFMGLYLLDMDRLYIPKDQASQQNSSLVDSLFGLAGKDQFKIFIFSLLLSTLLGFTRVDVRSSYNLLVANLNTLLVLLIFVVHQWCREFWALFKLCTSPPATLQSTPVCVDLQVLQNDLQVFELWNMQYFTGYHSIVSLSTGLK